MLDPGRFPPLLPATLPRGTRSLPPRGGGIRQPSGPIHLRPGRDRPERRAPGSHGGDGAAPRKHAAADGQAGGRGLLAPGADQEPLPPAVADGGADHPGRDPSAVDAAAAASVALNWGGGSSSCCPVLPQGRRPRGAAGRTRSKAIRRADDGGAPAGAAGGRGQRGAGQHGRVARLERPRTDGPDSPPMQL